MRYIVSYLPDYDGGVPKFIESGGMLPIGEEMVGVTVDDTKRWVPKTLKRLSKEALLKRGLDLGIDPIYIESWLKSIGFNYDQEV
jgi:hypothetical protein